MTPVAFTVAGFDGDVLRALDAQAPRPNDAPLTTIFGVVETAMLGAVSWYGTTASYEIGVDGKTTTEGGREVFELTLKLNASRPRP